MRSDHWFDHVRIHARGSLPNGAATDRALRLRSMDRCLDRSDLRRYLGEFYSSIGLRSIVLMISLLIVG